MKRFSRVAQDHWLDLAIVIAAIGAALEVGLTDNPLEQPSESLWFAVPATTLLVLPLLARRRFPFAAPASVWVLAVAISFVDGRLIPVAGTAALAGFAAAFMFGNLRDPIQSRAGLAVVLGGGAVVVYNDPFHDPAGLVFAPLLFAIGWLAGFAVRERSEQAAAAEMRALHAEREREAAARVAVAEERARMAREMHDVVAHAVSVMVLQVGAVRRRVPESSEEGEALRNVEHAGRTALAEMRRLLGAMRQGDDLLELTPGPGLDDLEALAGDVRAAGLDVRLHVNGEHAALPRSLDLSAYRIVQEGLTNALKHSGGRRADVTVDYAPDQLRLEVRDDGPGGFATGDGFGHGLIGIGERVKAYGGDMSAFVAATGGFVLRASLPLESADA